MCPMRILLIFFSAILAGFLAWKTMSSSKDAEEFQDEDKAKQEISTVKYGGFNMKMASEKVAILCWIMLDMASGKYLWRNLVDKRKSPT